MSIQAAEKTETAAHPAIGKGEVVTIAPTRLPYHLGLQDRFGVDRSAWRVLTDATFPAAKSVEAILMALSYCQTRKLDIFKRPVHIVPMWSSKAQDYIETVWPGIAELRTTAFRTGQYAGCDQAAFGETLDMEFKGRTKVKGEWTEKAVTVQFPEWCQMTVYRQLGGHLCKFVGPKVYWLESYATIGNSDLPNDMWQSRPVGQLEKCAEAAALRKAFPEEIGNELTAEEMEGRLLAEPGANARDVTPPPPPPPPSRKPSEARTEQPKNDAAKSDAAPSKPAAETAKSDTVPAIPDASKDPEAFLKWADAALAKVSDPEHLAPLFNDTIEPAAKDLFPPDRDALMASYSKHERRLGID